MVRRLLSKSETDKIVSDVRNIYHYLLGGELADLTRTPSTVIYDEPHCAIRRYNPTGKLDPSALPVLLIPPLAAPATCFDLRKGCSVAEFLVEQKRPTYLVDYGHVSTQVDADIGLDKWIDRILPSAIRTVSQDAGGVDLHLIGWSLGGILELFAKAAHPDLPVASIAAIASPFDFSKLWLLQPVRIAADVTGGRIAPTLFRQIGGVPGKINALGFRFADPIRLAQKPRFVMKMRDRPDVLAQIQAVDAMMDTMEAYPGKTITQMYKAFITTNEIADGELRVGDRVVSLDAVEVPVLTIAGDADNVFGPQASVEHLESLVPNAASYRMELAHGGHMGVLTGGGARESTWRYLNEFAIENDGR
ncbi:MAG: alpha/beta fold hydrolase [Candidatus Nanopelagicales bacterium]|nr:alpha/beta fold hydrolase [Candidatus Nanopelagicales bacterium]